MVTRYRRLVDESGGKEAACAAAGKGTEEKAAYVAGEEDEKNTKRDDKEKDGVGGPDLCMPDFRNGSGREPAAQCRRSQNNRVNTDSRNKPARRLRSSLFGPKRMDESLGLLMNVKRPPVDRCADGRGGRPFDLRAGHLYANLWFRLSEFNRIRKNLDSKVSVAGNAMKCIGSSAYRVNEGIRDRGRGCGVGPSCGAI